ncbi:hypothetical protein ACIOYV_00700 [Pseudomonas sp. NPDC087342]|uniref:hypothetical protein n=1 Tax=Pseudomonas sp. NPDC087342 TaxID=3364437 RepID=UPI003822764C
MELKWYIDSWAPTEGVAFVSKRKSCEDPWALEHTATLMIRAPEFEARPVDRAVAFGAARRGFQERFAIEGSKEYGFFSLEHLTTFVSRIYLGSGPGAGGGGGLPVEGGPGPKGSGHFRVRINKLARLKIVLSETNWGVFFLELLEASPYDRFTKIQGLLNEYVLLSALELLEESAHEAGGPQVRSNYLNWLAPTNRLETAFTAPLPHSYAQSLQLPEKLRSFTDLMSFIASDRAVIAGLSMAQVLPLLLATAIQLLRPSTISVYYRVRLYDEEGWQYWHHRFSDRYAQFILNWLPLAGLPSELEQPLKEWNQRSHEDQRARHYQG